MRNLVFNHEIKVDDKKTGGYQMSNGVIIEDNVLKVKGVVSVEELPSILSLVSNEVQAVRRYVEPLEPFLAIILTETCPAKIQGLKHRYPLAFTDWEILPYRNARVFTWGTLEQEQTSRIAYALLHYAAKDEALNEEFKQLFRKEFPEIETYCSRLKEGHQLTVRETLHLTRQIVKIEENVCPVSLVNAYAVVDYFVSMYEFSYDYETDQTELLDVLACLQRTIRLLLLEYSPKGYNTTIERVDDRNLKRLKVETKPYIQAYEAKLGLDLVKYCRKLALEYKDESLKTGYQVAIYRQFGQDVRSLMRAYPMTLADIEQLVYVLLETARTEQKLIKHPEVSDFCDYLEDRFVPAIVAYTHAKAFAMDRQFFFKTQGFSDAQMLQSLQKEIKQSNQKILELSQTVEGFEEEKMKLKESYSKQLAQQLKASNEELALVNQEKRKMQKELEELKEALELTKQQLSETEELNLLSTSTEESWEEKQARWIEQLNRPEILIVGCHPRTIHRLKTLLPNVKYYELDTNIQDHYLKGVEHIFICLHQVNHAMTFKLDRCCGDEVPRYPIRKTNAQLIIQELAQTLGLE